MTICGFFLVGKNKYSKCYKFSDINYAVASKEEKEAIFLEYSELLNSFETGATTKITIKIGLNGFSPVATSAEIADTFIVKEDTAKQNAVINEIIDDLSFIFPILYIIIISM